MKPITLKALDDLCAGRITQEEYQAIVKARLVELEPHRAQMERNLDARIRRATANLRARAVHGPRA